MKVFITKFALTRGIVEIDAEICSTISKNMIQTTADKGRFDIYYHKPDWHESKDDAIKKANEMRDKKIASLKKQIQKLEKFKF